MSTEPSQNPTPSSDGGASTLDRIEAYLAPQSQPVKQEPAVQAQAEPEAQEVERESVEPDEGGKEQADEPQLSTSDLAKLLKLEEGALDLDDEGNAVFKTKVDGKEGAAKLQDLLKSYQLQEHVDRRTREAAAREQALQAREQEVQQQFTQRLQYADNLTNVALQDLMREAQRIERAAQEGGDPGQIAYAKVQLRERLDSLRNVQAQIEQNKAQMTQREAQNRQQLVAKEAEKLVSLVPEWKDSSVAEKERGEIRKWATESGFEAGELDGFVLAHHVNVMRKAMKYDQQQKLRPAIEAQVRTAPKLVKPGQPAQNTQGQKLQGLKQSIVKSGGKRGIAEYLLASGKV